MEPNLLIVLLGTMTITSYQPIPAQTKPECKDRYHCTTSIDDGITQYGAAVSQDLLHAGIVHYGDVLHIEGLGTLRVVNDTMNKRHKRHIDLLVFSYAEEHKIGTQHRRVWVIHPQGEKQWNIKHTQQRSQHRAEGHGSPSVIQPSDTTVHCVGS
jgi:3D (Asp-Asp-Asp) domain-containing protein